MHTNNSNSCNDGNACTSGDVCSDGVCNGSAIVCNDNNLCTNDECNPSIGCYYVPITANVELSGINYPQNTIKGPTSKGALNNLYTIQNAVPPTDPAFIFTKIGIGSPVNFFAGNSITLHPGFQTQNGTIFKAEIGKCN